jgi:hypothetical protein
MAYNVKEVVRVTDIDYEYGYLYFCKAINGKITVLRCKWGAGAAYSNKLQSNTFLKRRELVELGRKFKMMKQRKEERKILDEMAQLQKDNKEGKKQWHMSHRRP